MKSLVVCIYSHPEAYPPTLNAINELSEVFDSISVVHRPLLQSKWDYPRNTRLFSSGTQMSEAEQVLSPLPQKIFFFIRFTLLLLKMIRRSRPAVILVYDQISLYGYSLLRPFIRYPHQIWYHNHDVVEEGSQRKYSVGWLAQRHEKQAFAYLSIFSLPTNSRRSYFNLEGFTGKYFCIPNYPARKRYAAFRAAPELSFSVRLIFQGSMDSSHGIEELIPLLKEAIIGKEPGLLLVGKSKEGYKESIDELSRQHGVANKVRFEGLIPYSMIPEYTASANIGMAIYRNQNVMSTTMGTASNKIYEYAALGLPVICLDTAYYREQRQQFPWIFVTDCSPDSYLETVGAIIMQYPVVSAAARRDFMNQLNFEVVFEPVKEYILTFIQPLGRVSH